MTLEHSAYAGELRNARRARLRQTLAGRDALRAVRAAKDLGATQTVIARELHVSQPAVSQMLERQPIDAPLVVAGHTGATAYEVAERYAAGLLSREAMRAELSAWDYAPAAGRGGLVDDLPVDDLSTFDAIDRALRHGLIDDDDYDAIADAYEARQA